MSSPVLRMERADSTERADRADSIERADLAASTERADLAASTERAERAASTDLAERAASTERAERAASTERAERAASTDLADRAASTERAERAASTDLADRADCTDLAERAEIVFLDSETAGLPPRLPTRISDISRPVADLIFAFWASVSLIFTSFAICRPSFCPSLSQRWNQLRPDRVQTLKALLHRPLGGNGKTHAKAPLQEKRRLFHPELKK
ncbi:MAG: hypothetical protein ABR576_10640 [Thermoanaerobaculia bacterium]